MRSIEKTQRRIYVYHPRRFSSRSSGFSGLSLSGYYFMFMQIEKLPYTFSNAICGEQFIVIVEAYSNSSISFI